MYLTLGLRLFEMGGSYSALFGSTTLIEYLSKGGRFLFSEDKLINRGKGGETYDAQPKTGRALQLGATNELAIPIFHTLGVDTKQIPILGTGWTANGNNTYTGSNTSTSLTNLSTLTLYSSMTLEITFEITAITAGTVEGKSAVGNYTIYKVLETITCASFSGTIIIKSLKQINNDNSFLTYTDIATNKIIHLGNSVDNTGNTPELLENYNTVPSSATWTSGTITNLPDGFTKIDYGSAPNSFFYFRATNPEFKENLVEGKSYRVIGEFKTDGINAYPVVAGQPLTEIIPVSSTNGVIPFDVTFKATSAGTMVVSCYCDVATNRVIYWKLTSVNEVLSLAPTYNFLNKTVNNILTTHTTFNSNDLTKLQSNPNLLANLAMNGSAEELDMVLVGDEGWYACTEENDKYVINANAARGRDISLLQPTFAAGSSNVSVSVIGTVIKITGVTNTNTSRYAYSNLSTTSPAMLSRIPVKDKHYVFEFLGRVSHEVVGGKPFTAWGGATEVVYPFSIQQNVWQRYAFISKATGITTDFFGIYENTNTIGATIELDAATLTIREIAATEITNYVETIRTNADLNPVGLQTLCLELDSLGVPQSYTETVLKHNAKQEILFPLTTPYTYTTIKDIVDIKSNTADRLLISYADGSDEVIPPTFGAELVVNGSFDTDTAWAKGTGWTISAGSANCDGTQVSESELQSVNSIMPTAGKSYQLFLSVGSVAAGAFKILAGDGSTGWLNTNGAYTHAFVHGGGNIYVDIVADADFIGAINSISIREIL